MISFFAELIYYWKLGLQQGGVPYGCTQKHVIVL